MISLFLKDIKILKKVLPWVFGICIVLPIIIFSNHNMENDYEYSVFNSFNLIYLQLFFYEAKSASFIASLPVTRNNIIIMRYINGIIFIVFSLIIGFISINLNSLFHFGTLIHVNNTVLIQAAISVFVILSWFAILNPVMFKMEKTLVSTAGYTGSVVTIIVLFMTTSFVSQYLIEYVQTNGILKLGFLMSGSIILYLISLYISILIYKRKEF